MAECVTEGYEFIAYCCQAEWNYDESHSENTWWSNRLIPLKLTTGRWLLSPACLKCMARLLILRQYFSYLQGEKTG